MKISARSVLLAPLATITASAVVIAPSVQPPPRPAPTIQLAASSQILQQPLALTAIPRFDPAAFLLGTPPSAGQPFPTPQFPPVIVGNSIDATIKNIYKTIEPWVQWGFEVAAYAVGWIPYVGWLAPQINIFYSFGEQIVQSIVFNVADWLGGNVSFAQGLVNVGVDTINAFINLANAQLAFWLPSIPPIPPLPPICLRCNTLTTTSLDAAAVDTPLTALVDAVDEPTTSEQDRIYALKGMWGRLQSPADVQERMTKLLDALDLPAAGVPDLLERFTDVQRPDSASAVGAIPSIVKTPFKAVDSLRETFTRDVADGLERVTKPVTEVRPGIRDERTDDSAPAERGLRNPGGTADTHQADTGKPDTDVSQPSHRAKADKDARAATAPKSAAKSAGDAARKAVSDVRKAVKDVRDSGKKRRAAQDDG